MSGVPPISELSAILTEPLAAAVPFHEDLSQELPRIPNDVLRYSVTESASKLLPIIATIVYGLHHSESEDSYVQLIDCLIKEPIILLAKYLSVGLTYDRNVSDKSQLSTTIDALRPDFMLWLPNGVLGFKGEEKKDGWSIDVPRLELLAKCNNISTLLIGNLPYQLCYASVGGKIVFYVIDLGAAPVSIEYLAGPFNATANAAERAKIVRCAVNCFRVLRALCQHLPFVPALSMGQVLTRRDKRSKLVILKDCVSKIVDNGCYCPSVIDLYKEILPRPIDFLTRPKAPPKMRNKHLSVYLTPLGLQNTPTCENDLKAALRCVLVALSQLHARGWVHRDVRWDNILFVPTENSWYLIDLECADRNGQRLPDWYNRRLAPPEVQGDEALYATSADIWQVGMLISIDCSSSSAQDLRSQLLSDDAASRLSALQALAHPFIQ